MRSFRHQSVVPAVWPGLRGCCFFSPLPYPFRRLNRMNWPLPCRQLDQVQAALERARGPPGSPARLSHPVTSLIIPGRVPIWRPFVMASIAISRLPGPSPVQRQP